MDHLNKVDIIDSESKGKLLFVGPVATNQNQIDTGKPLSFNQIGQVVQPNNNENSQKAASDALASVIAGGVTTKTPSTPSKPEPKKGFGGSEGFNMEGLGAMFNDMLQGGGLGEMLQGGGLGDLLQGGGIGDLLQGVAEGGGGGGDMLTDIFQSPMFKDMFGDGGEAAEHGGEAAEKKTPQIMDTAMKFFKNMNLGGILKGLDEDTLLSTLSQFIPPEFKPLFDLVFNSVEDKRALVVGLMTIVVKSLKLYEADDVAGKENEVALNMILTYGGHLRDFFSNKKKEDTPINVQEKSGNLEEDIALDELITSLFFKGKPYLPIPNTVAKNGLPTMNDGTTLNKIKERIACSQTTLQGMDLIYSLTDDEELAVKKIRVRVRNQIFQFEKFSTHFTCEMISELKDSIEVTKHTVPEESKDIIKKLFNKYFTELEHSFKQIKEQLQEHKMMSKQEVLEFVDNYAPALNFDAKSKMIKESLQEKEFESMSKSELVALFEAQDISVKDHMESTCTLNVVTNVLPTVNVNPDSTLKRDHTSTKNVNMIIQAALNIGGESIPLVVPANLDMVDSYYTRFLNRSTKNANCNTIGLKIGEETDFMSSPGVRVEHHGRAHMLPKQNTFHDFVKVSLGGIASDLPKAVLNTKDDDFVEKKKVLLEKFRSSVEQPYYFLHHFYSLKVIEEKSIELTAEDLRVHYEYMTIMDGIFAEITDKLDEMSEYDTSIFRLNINDSVSWVSELFESNLKVKHHFKHLEEMYQKVSPEQKEKAMAMFQSANPMDKYYLSTVFEACFKEFIDSIGALLDLERVKLSLSKNNLTVREIKFDLEGEVKQINYRPFELVEPTGDNVFEQKILSGPDSNVLTIERDGRQYDVSSKYFNPDVSVRVKEEIAKVLEGPEGYKAFKYLKEQIVDPINTHLATLGDIEFMTESKDNDGTVAAGSFPVSNKFMLQSVSFDKNGIMDQIHLVNADLTLNMTVLTQASTSAGLSTLKIEEFRPNNVTFPDRLSEKPVNMLSGLGDLLDGFGLGNLGGMFDNYGGN